MSSFTRTLQRALNRGVYYNGRGSRLGVTNATAPDRLARLAREERRDDER